MNKNIKLLKESSGVKYFAGCVGKTSFSKESVHYETTVKMAEILVEKGIGVIHGGYQGSKGGGAMQGYAQGADNIIQKNGLHKCYNIGIPESRFDDKRGIEERTKYNTQFCTPYPNIDERCGALIDNTDILVVNELGGNGTIREVFTQFERNDIHKPNNLGMGNISPIVFYGENRKELFSVLSKNFKIGTKIEDDKNLYFVNNLNQYSDTIASILVELSS